MTFCHNFIFFAFLFQPWLVLSFPRCKEGAALLLSLFPFFLFFFHFSFTAQNYLLWWTTKRKKIALQALFWGKARPRKKKKEHFLWIGQDRSLHLLPVSYFWHNHINSSNTGNEESARARTNKSWQNGIRNAKSFLEDTKTFLKFVTYSKEKKKLAKWFKLDILDTICFTL